MLIQSITGVCKCVGEWVGVQVSVYNCFHFANEISIYQSARYQRAKQSTNGPKKRLFISRTIFVFKRGFP